MLRSITVADFILAIQQRPVFRDQMDGGCADAFNAIACIAVGNRHSPSPKYPLHIIVVKAVDYCRVRRARPPCKLCSLPGVLDYIDQIPTGLRGIIDYESYYRQIPHSSRQVEVLNRHVVDLPDRVAGLPKELESRESPIPYDYDLSIEDPQDRVCA